MVAHSEFFLTKQFILDFKFLSLNISDLELNVTEMKNSDIVFSTSLKYVYLKNMKLISVGGEIKNMTIMINDIEYLILENFIIEDMIIYNSTILSISNA